MFQRVLINYVVRQRVSIIYVRVSLPLAILQDALVYSCVALALGMPKLKLPSVLKRALKQRRLFAAPPSAPSRPVRAPLMPKGPLFSSVPGVRFLQNVSDPEGEHDLVILSATSRKGSPKIRRAVNRKDCRGSPNVLSKGWLVIQRDVYVFNVERSLASRLRLSNMHL